MRISKTEHWKILNKLKKFRNKIKKCLNNLYNIKRMESKKRVKNSKPNKLMKFRNKIKQIFYNFQCILD